MQAAQQGLKTFLLIGLIAALTACGGGSSSNNPPPPVPDDTTPDAFSFSPASDVDRAQLITSDAVTISGIDAPAPVSVTGGEYSIDGGAFTAEEGSISAGQSIRLRTTAADAYSDDVEVNLLIGGVEAVFTVTTLADLIPATASFDIDLGIREDIVITFGEEMDPNSLELEGLLVELAGDPTWNDERTELRLSPVEGAWESGLQNLAGAVDDIAGNTTALDIDFEIRLVFETFQAASVVIGQPDFTSSEANQGGSTAPNTLLYPAGRSTVSEGRLWIPDYMNHRILGFDGVPSTNNAAALWVVGQPDLYSNTAGTSASALHGPVKAIEHQRRFYVLDYRNNRVAIFDDLPLAPPAAAVNVIGQPDLAGDSNFCGALGLSGPQDMEISAGKLVVADTLNDRVLIWDTVPADNAVPADVVVGQASMSQCSHNDDDQDGSPDGTASARTLSYPSGVWSDGERLVVGDGKNGRILIWNTFPSTSFTPADLVLGQSNFQNSAHNDDDQDGVYDDQPSARTFSTDEFFKVWSNGLQLFVADIWNNRVMIWNNFPTRNFQPADAVIGQSDFMFHAANDDDQDGSTDDTPTARTLRMPGGGGLHRDKMLIFDTDNSRVLIFESR